MQNIGHVLLSIFEDYFSICKSMISSTSYGVARVISYAGLLYTSMRICYHLPTVHDEDEMKSWVSYLKSDIPVRKHNFIANLACKGGPVLIFLVFLFDYGNGIEYSECSIP